MDIILRAFLAELAARRFAFGRTDCALVLSDWCERVTGQDPAGHLRGAYHDEASCAALLRAHGHLPRLVGRLARQAGARRIDAPEPGDFAVIRRDRWFGAIRTPSGRWAVKCNDGLAAYRDCRVVAAWRF